MYDKMGKLIDLTGQHFGRLTVIRRDTERKSKSVYWLCQCECGNTISVRAYNLKSGNTVSCGCKNSENIHRKQRNAIDITGKRFGRLTAIEYVRSGKNGAIWRCECDCGNEIQTYVSYLTNGNVQSCGCLEIENRKMQNQKMLDQIVYDTNIGIIKKTTPNKNSSTGIRGVSWCKSKQKYIASITFQKKHYTLCQSTDIDKCIEARKEAEKQIFGNFLEWYNEQKK